MFNNVRVAAAKQTCICVKISIKNSKVKYFGNEDAAIYSIKYKLLFKNYKKSSKLIDNTTKGYPANEMLEPTEISKFGILAMMMITNITISRAATTVCQGFQKKMAV